MIQNTRINDNNMGEQAININQEVTKQCPICHKKMIKQYANYVLTSYPPQYPWNWYCGCGHTEPGGVERGITLEETIKKQWEKANETRFRR